MKKKVIRITTVPISMNKILNGQLNYINSYYDVIGISRYVEKDFIEIRNREGIKMHSVPFARTINLLKDISCLVQLVKIFREEKPHIVHTHTPKAGLLGMIAAKITNVPVRLHTVGGMPLTEATGVKLMVLKFTEKLTYRFAHKIYPNSNGLKEFILENKFTTSDKLKVIGNGSSNGIDAEYYRNDYVNSESERNKLRKSLGIADGDFVFLFIGRLAREKGIHELLNAFKKLSVNNNHIKLLLIGTVELENGSISNEDIERIKTSKNIIAPGRTDNVRGFLKVGDCFVLPTYREGFPNALLQAGSMGLPLIATNINGCNEIIEENVSGFLIAPKNEEQLFIKMNTILFDNELRATFSKNIRDTVKDKFKQNIVWKAILNEYDSFNNRIN